MGICKQSAPGIKGYFKKVTHTTNPSVMKAHRDDPDGFWSDPDRCTCAPLMIGQNIITPKGQGRHCWKHNPPDIAGSGSFIPGIKAVWEN